MKSVHFGAGNIGRGFLGQLYFESGYETTFVDVVADVVSALQSRRAYPLRVVGENARTLQIGNVTAISASDKAAVADAVADADLVSTAVGVKVLAHVAPMLAAGIAKRANGDNARPINIIVCENLIDAGDYLREEVRKHLPRALYEFLDGRVGFVEASIGRMVPLMTAEMKAEDPLLVCVEAYCELPVDVNAFKGRIPPLRHMKPCPNFKAYVERKLFVHNAGHACAAYFGYLRGCHYIWQAMADERIVAETDAAMAESCAGLSKRHGIPRPELDEHWADLRRRFENRDLGDQVMRVAADPIRKLGPNDRLIGAAQMCLGQGVTPARLAFAAAAAIRYDHASDPAARHLQQIRSERGLTGVLEQVCQIEKESSLAGLIEQGTRRLLDEGWIS